jgi:transposase InsO family protein
LRLSLPGGDHRLGEPGGAGLAAVEHDGRRVSRVNALDEALARFGKPEIFNTDQGSQFTSAAFTGRLAGAGIRISMDGRGRWMDNVFIERLWR